MLLEYHKHTFTSQIIMLYTSTLLDPLTKYILTQFYFLDTLTSKTGLHVVFAGLGRPVQDIVGRICCICPFQIYPTRSGSKVQAEARS